MSEEFGSAEAGKKGGKARAKSLSKEERQEIARRGALARWEKQESGKIPRATHEGVLAIGDEEIPCAVLENGVHVVRLVRIAVVRAMVRRPPEHPFLHARHRQKREH